MVENEIILDPGSHPASRDLAGMTNWGTASRTIDIILPAAHRAYAPEGRNGPLLSGWGETIF